MVDLFVRAVPEQMDRKTLRRCGEELAVGALHGRCCHKRAPRVLRDDAGKPFAPGFDAFSIAHSGEVLVCGVARLQCCMGAAGCAAEKKLQCDANVVDGDGNRKAAIGSYCGEADVEWKSVRCVLDADPWCGASVAERTAGYVEDVGLCCGGAVDRDGTDSLRCCRMDTMGRSETRGMVGSGEAVGEIYDVGAGLRRSAMGERLSCGTKTGRQWGADAARCAVETKRRCCPIAEDGDGMCMGTASVQCCDGAVDENRKNNVDMGLYCGDIDVKQKAERCTVDTCMRRGDTGMVDECGEYVAKCGMQYYDVRGDGAAECRVGHGVVGKRIGVDVEKIRPRRVDEIAARFFSKREREFLTAQPDEIHRLRAFYQIWTRKEAYLKMTGEGLGQRTLCHVDTQSLEKAGVWFWQRTIWSGTYMLCVCMETTDEVRLRFDEDVHI